jgi:NADPH-dependent curcumin reductase CurA
MEERTNRRILLVEKPADKLAPEHFRLTQAPAPAPQDGEVLLRVRYISLDAANRAWMRARPIGPPSRPEP